MKQLEIQIGDRIAKVQLISSEGSNMKVSIDGKVHDADIIMVERGVYSLLLEGRSYNVELIEQGSPKKYHVSTIFNAYDVEVVDAESKYLKSRKKLDSAEDMVISSPMPGKVVRIPFQVGEQVKAGDTVIIVSAMKMESEYKVKSDRTIVEIRVKEGDTVGANQPLIIVT
jgi:biotin carboxyl carrier protein